MGLDKRYPAFLLIVAVFLGFFLYASSTSKKEPPADASPAPLPEARGPLDADSPRRGETTLPVFPIDLNKATVRELTLLPGIGEKTARRIVEKRAELGGYREVDELTEVKWIGKAKLEKIRDLVIVEGKQARRGASR